MASNVFSALVDSDDDTPASDDSNKNNYLNKCYKTKREWLYKNNNCNLKTHIDNNQFRLVSYNILADGENLALGAKHDYCPLELREWELRFDKIKKELSSYNADIVHLQEILPLHFLRDFQPFFQSKGYNGTYFRDPHNTKHNSIAVATFVRKTSFKKLFEKKVYFWEMIGPNHAGKLKKKILNVREGVLLQLLKHSVTGNLVLSMNTHIHWDPSYPNIKAQQCAFACEAAISFLKKDCGGLEVEKDNISIVLAGDLNSIRNVQLEFLPSIQKQWYVHDGENNKLGGAYQLLSTGKLHQLHPEHPDSFAKSSPPIIENKNDDAAILNPKKKKIKKNSRKYVGVLQTNINFTHVYKEQRIPFTTKCPDFQGPLDYIFYTFETCNCIGFLEMPYVFKPAMKSGTGTFNLQKVENVKLSSNDFPFIPNDVYPSDHLAIGGIFEFKKQ